MARARNIKPGFYANEDLAECSVWARYIFPGLWMLADREGRLEDRPKRIKGELLRYDNVDVEPLLFELEKRGFIVRYAVGERQLIQVAAFDKHQNPHHREAPSLLPAPSSRGLEVGDTTAEPKPSPSDESQAQGDADASPGPAPGSAQPTPVPAVLIPDSLIPDSQRQAYADSEPQHLDKLDAEVAEIYRLHPKNATMVAAGKLCPSGQERLIAEAIVQDGYETVQCGTRNLADAFGKRPKDELRFCPSPEKFFSVSNPGYQTDPVCWQGETPKAMAATAMRDTAPRESPLDKMRRELASD